VAIGIGTKRNQEKGEKIATLAANHSPIHDIFIFSFFLQSCISNYFD
jgi:hypothetical protein